MQMFVLKDRQFLRLGTRLSTLFDQEMGVPQASILLVTLFALKINSIVNAICFNVECSLYVDDFLICYRSKHMHIIERHLQRCLNKLQYWADTNGFHFSTSKTVCIHFCRLLHFKSFITPIFDSFSTSHLGLAQFQQLPVCIQTWLFHRVCPTASP